MALQTFFFSSSFSFSLLPPLFFYIPVVMNVNNGGTLLHYSVQRRVGRRPTIREDITTQVCTLGRLQSHYALLLIIVWSIASEGPSFLTMNRKNGKPVEPCSTTRLDILVIPSLPPPLPWGIARGVLDDDLMGREEGGGGVKDERLSRLRDVTMPIVNGVRFFLRCGL